MSFGIICCEKCNNNHINGNEEDFEGDDIHVLGGERSVSGKLVHQCM